MKPAPVALFVYNRPGHVRDTVAALGRNSLAQDSELWIFSDGPRDAGAEEGVKAVRRYVEELPSANLFRSVRLTQASRNLGLANSIICGVTTVLALNDRVIVLEDDLLTAPDFLDFMNACLEHYEGAPTIGSISGYTPLKAMPPNYSGSVYVLPRSCSWGWATWKNRWAEVDWDVRDFGSFWKDRRAREAFDRCGADCSDMLFRQMVRGIDSWSIRFGYWQFRSGRQTVYPRVSRVKNIGVDGSGVHSNHPGTQFNDDCSDVPTSFELTLPPVDDAVAKRVRALYEGRWPTRLGRWLRGNGLGLVDSMLRSLRPAP